MLQEIKNIISYVEYIASALGAVGVIWLWLSGAYKKIINVGKSVCPGSHEKQISPKNTLTIVPKYSINGVCFFWHMGQQGDVPAMQLSGKFIVTNLKEQPIRLVGAKIKKSKVKGEVLVNLLNSNYYGSYELMPGKATEISISFWITPPLLIDMTKNFFDRVAIIDQYGNKYWTEKIEFKTTKSF